MLKKAQEEIKKIIDKNHGETEKYKVKEIVLLSTKDLKFQIAGQRTEKLTEQFVSPYKIKSIVSMNIMGLELLELVRIHPVVDMSKIQIDQEKVMG